LVRVGGIERMIGAVLDDLVDVTPASVVVVRATDTRDKLPRVGTRLVLSSADARPTNERTGHNRHECDESEASAGWWARAGFDISTPPAIPRPPNATPRGGARHERLLGTSTRPICFIRFFSFLLALDSLRLR